jgi:hypothetical protein
MAGNSPHMSHHIFSRRAWLQAAAVTGTAAALPPLLTAAAGAADAPASSAVALGSRRELFLDDFLIAKLDGATLKAHQPEPRDVVITCDAPWEGNTSAYYTIFADDDRFRMYYRGWHWDEATKKEAHPEFACYAESRDGLTFTKPKLGLFDFNGSKENNIVSTGPVPHNFTPFKDTNPACPPEARYKALSGNRSRGLDPFQSADGIRWTHGLTAQAKLGVKAVIKDGAFDSQNLAFWDAARGEYRAYWRYFTDGGYKGVRAIRTATSKDFLVWENQADLRYVDSPAEHLYTNAILPYARAPHLFIGFPTRFQPKHQQVEPVFMSSRDGVLFKRWPEPLIPITAPKDRDGNRSNYMAWGLLQLPGQERELSVYATEAYYTGSGSRVRRFVFRTDGFVSVRAGATGGTLLTKPLTFDGARLTLNIASKGATRVEVQDAGGKALPGFTLADASPIIGDFIEHTVMWKSGSDLRKLAGQPLRLKFELRDADVFAMKFNA